MKKYRTHYDNLKVTQDASATQIRWAYKRLSQRLHPDKNKHDSEACRKFQLISQAYRVLINPDTRQKYDCWIEQQLTKLAIKNCILKGPAAHSFARTEPMQNSSVRQQSPSPQCHSAQNIESTRIKMKKISSDMRSKKQNNLYHEVLQTSSTHQRSRRTNRLTFTPSVLVALLTFFTPPHLDRIPAHQLGDRSNPSSKYALSHTGSGENVTDLSITKRQAERLSQEHKYTQPYYPVEHSEEWIRENIF